MTAAPQVTRELVIAAYRLFLDRQPENEQVIQNALKHATIEHLRRAFLYSEEFSRQLSEAIVNSRFPLDLEQESQIEVQCEESKLRQLFARVESTWEQLGKEDPYWSVATWDGFRKERFVQNEKSFWESGKRDVTRLQVWLQRNRIVPRPEWTCLEYGCGTGRVTGWLAKQFKSVIACDISNAHLSIARSKDESRGSVQFKRIEKIEEAHYLPPADLLFSIIVLQHNPPPVIAHILDGLLARIRSGGIAYFQVPTFWRGYRFDVDQYLANKGSGMEMHVLPQRHVFEIARKNQCHALEVQADSLIGTMEGVSTTFLFQKAT
jgi:SAM-dependent methyltransferase